MALSDVSGIVKVILSFFRHGEEGAFERHRSRISVSCEKHRLLKDMKKYVTKFFGGNQRTG